MFDLTGKAALVTGASGGIGAETARVLHGETVTVGGLVLAGLGGAVPPLPPLPWASWDLTETEARALLAPIGHADILITHSPPHGIADTTARKPGHLGSVAIRAAIERLQPRLALCGHIHDCWGQGGQIGATEIRNLGPGLTWFEF